MEAKQNLHQPSVNHLNVKLQDALSQTLNEVVHNLQPMLTKTLTDLSNDFLTATRSATTSAVAKAQKNPWYFIGGAVALLLFTGFVINRRHAHTAETDHDNYFYH